MVDSDRQMRNLKKLSNPVKIKKEEHRETAYEFFIDIPFVTMENLPKLRQLETDIRFDTE